MDSARREVRRIIAYSFFSPGVGSLKDVVVWLNLRAVL
jgi:hypothetical protein